MPESADSHAKAVRKGRVPRHSVLSSQNPTKYEGRVLHIGGTMKISKDAPYSYSRHPLRCARTHTQRTFPTFAALQNINKKDVLMLRLCGQIPRSGTCDWVQYGALCSRARVLRR